MISVGMFLAIQRQHNASIFTADVDSSQSPARLCTPTRGSPPQDRSGTCQAQCGSHRTQEVLRPISLRALVDVYMLAYRQIIEARPTKATDLEEGRKGAGMVWGRLFFLDLRGSPFLFHHRTLQSTAFFQTSIEGSGRWAWGARPAAAPPPPPHTRGLGARFAPPPLDGEKSPGPRR